MCERCEAIRYQAAFIMAISLGQQATVNVIQTVAVMHSILKHSAIQGGHENEFNKIWKMMTKNELEQVSLENPIEPLKFDDNYDVREHLKK